MGNKRWYYVLAKDIDLYISIFSQEQYADYIYEKCRKTAQSFNTLEDVVANMEEQFPELVNCTLTILGPKEIEKTNDVTLPENYHTYNINGIYNDDRIIAFAVN